jgi:hypothetical protein
VLAVGETHQGISDEKAEKAAEKGSTPVTMATPRPSTAVAPSGRGCETEGDGRRQAHTRTHRRCAEGGAGVVVCTYTRGQRGEGWGADRGDDAHDGTEEDGEQLPRFERHADGCGDEPHDQSHTHGDGQRLHVRATRRRRGHGRGNGRRSGRRGRHLEATGACHLDGLRTEPRPRIRQLRACVRPAGTCEVVPPRTWVRGCGLAATGIQCRPSSFPTGAEAPPNDLTA